MYENQPIVILGMHRSGTTLITKILEQLGLFVGTKKEINNESLFFFYINNWIFDLCTATDTMPHNLRYVNPACKQVIEESLAHFVQSNKRKLYLGNYASKYKDIRAIDFPYGWKEPKMSFTMDFWKAVFPNAKIIHVYRNPIDVAQSYMERDTPIKGNFSWTWKKKLKRDFLITHKFHGNFRITSIEAGYEVWKEYVEKALSLKNDFDDYIMIQYEDFLSNPKTMLNNLLLPYCNLTPSNTEIEKAIAPINKSRAYSFLDNEVLLQFYHQIKNDDLMQQLNYQQIV